MVRIATAAVAVSIAVVVISLAVIFGFKEQISTLVTESVSDVTISQSYASTKSGAHPISENEALLFYGDFYYPDREGVKRKTILCRKITVLPGE
jgi:ABC-type lipoprotein release transport system permease subunit